MATALPRTMFLTAGNLRSREVCLTFDDGPDPELTPRLLDVLDGLSIRATFFVIGEKAERHPRIVRRIADDGHALGNHTWSHRLASALSMSEFVNEVDRTNRLLADITGATVKLFRPPLGKITARQMLRLWRGRQSIILWNSDPKDYQCASADEARVRLADGGLKSGDLILLHDDRPIAVDIVPNIAATAAATNLSFVTIPEWTRPA